MKISMYYSRTSDQKQGRPYSCASRRRWWLVLTQICHHWRATALLTPLLWSYIDTNIFLGHYLLETSLSRSAGTALDVTTCDETNFMQRSNVSSGLAKVMQESHRIRNLVLKALFPSILTSPFPGLEYLEIDTEHHNVPSGSNPVLRHFLKHSPILRSVTFTNVSLHSLILSTLPLTVAHLYIDQARLHYQSRCWDPEVIDALKRLPQLETLSLSNTVRPLREGMVGTTIFLPKLRHLTVRDMLENIEPPFKSFVFPSTARVHLETKIEEHEVITLCTNLLSQSYSACLARSPKFTVLCDFGGVTFNFGLCALGRFNSCDRCQLFLKLWSRQAGLKDIHIWSRFLEIPSTKAILSRCESLHLKNISDFPESEVVELISLAQDVETLLISGGDSLMGGVILEALRPSPDGSVPLAKLKQLDLILPYGKNLSEYFNKEEFCQCLERRKEHGYKLRSLSTRGTSKDRKIFDLKDLEITDQLRAVVDVND